MVLETIQEAGIGGTALAVYTYLVLEVAPINLNYRPQILYSTIPVVVLILLIDSFNDPIMKRIAGADFLEGVHNQVREEVGDDQFYYDFEDKQQKIDELDRKAVGRVVNIIVGGIIALTLPFIGLFVGGISGLAVGIVAAVLVSYILVVRQRVKLRNIISKLARLY